MALCVAAVACGLRERGSVATDGPVTESQANRYISKAIRQSSEGVILLPSKKAERVYELQRLNDIAQNIRRPAAVCFINRAIETMKATEADGELVFEGVPEGQAKMRVRISPAGEVLRTEVLESGFRDEAMEPCLEQAVRGQNWPENKSGHAHYIDVVYWVSLGAQEGLTPKVRLHLRRAQTAAGVRARRCLEGTVDAATYVVRGLNLVDREGKTIVNRVDPSGLPERTAACVSQALSEIGLPQDAATFVRPVVPVVEFEVTREGAVKVKDEEWLALIEREERALRAAERAELAGADGDTAASGGRDEGGTADGEAPVATAAADPPQDAPRSDPPAPTPREQTPRGDPGKGGQKLELGTRRGGD